MIGTALAGSASSLSFKKFWCCAVPSQCCSRYFQCVSAYFPPCTLADQKISKNTQRRPPDVPSTARNGPRAAQDSAKTARDAPDISRYDPKTAQDAPRWPQDGLRRVRTAPRRLPRQTGRPGPAMARRAGDRGGGSIRILTGRWTTGPANLYC